LTIENGIGILTIDSPPVNALSLAVRKHIDDGIRRFVADPDVRAIVVICAGRTFFAGADIGEFGKPVVSPTLPDVLTTIETSPKPVIAAIHGTALGGGYELALVCHYRIASASAKVGLPEVHLGLLPAAGGTQRLPRIVGVETALDIITGGKPVQAERALALGMIDALADDGRLRSDAIALARNVVAAGLPLPRVRDRTDKLEAARSQPGVYEAFAAKNARAFRGFKAPGHIIKAVAAAAELPFEEGLAREHELFLELLESPESAAQRYAFFAERETIKVPDIPPAIRPLSVATVGIIGAGTMGCGIAMNFLNSGMPVTLVEASQPALDRGVAVIHRNYEASAAKGRMTADQVDERMALLSPTLSIEALREVDLAIEAVFEEIAVKKQIFATLDRIAKPGAILASNTSFLDLDDIAGATGRPEWVVGLHFFSPANVMRLLEVVRGKRTSQQVVATAMKLARSIGKVPVLSEVCDGFIANRLMSHRMIQSEALVLEGPTPDNIDRVLRDYGFAMGPFQMIDLVGLDVIGRDDARRTLRGDLVLAGRLGQKQNGGYYDYDEKRRPTPSPVAASIIRVFADSIGVADHGPQSDADILARLLYPVVNEGAKILEEGIALRASDIDIAAILGYGWPIYTGGPMFWADTIGLPKIVAALETLRDVHGDVFAPASLLSRLAAEGGSFTR
jgi:3-hydroxyacyl-CoA dehydrogenase